MVVFALIPYRVFIVLGAFTSTRHNHSRTIGTDDAFNDFRFSFRNFMRVPESIGHSLEFVDHKALAGHGFSGSGLLRSFVVRSGW